MSWRVAPEFGRFSAAVIYFATADPTARPSMATVLVNWMFCGAMLIGGAGGVVPRCRHYIDTARKFRRRPNRRRISLWRI